MANPSSDPYVIQSALRTLRTLLTFGGVSRSITLAELVDITGEDKSGLYRSLRTLVVAGFLRQDRDGSFSLTRAVHLLSAAVGRNQDLSLVETAAPFLDDLAFTSGEDVHLGAVTGDFLVVIDKRTSAAAVRLSSIGLGQSVPLHAGAMPKAALAFSDDAVIEATISALPQLPVYAEGTARHADALRREIAEIRERGWSISSGDFDMAARGVGAPIFDETSHVIGAISVGGPAFRISDERLDGLGHLIRDTAEAISRAMGSSGPSQRPAPTSPNVQEA